MEFRYTDKELKKISKTYRKVLNEFWKLWKSSPVEEIKVEFDLKGTGEKDWVFEMCDNYIDIYGTVPGYLPFKETRKLRLRLSELEVIGHKHNGIDLKNMQEFLMCYDSIKSGFLEEMRIGAEKKQACSDKIDDINRRIDNHDANIEIDMPFQNQSKIEIGSEDGRNIGVIDFGDRTIKIITNGSIVLVNRDKNKGLVKNK